MTNATDATEVPALTLHDGVEIPQLGFGVFQIPSAETQEAVEEALGVGYRHIDTAAAYRNEAGVGSAIAVSGIDREDVFVTTKLWNSQQGYDSTLRAFDKSLRQLGTEYVDLYLIHWPQPDRDLFPETWRAFERLREEGRVRSIGVSNFTEEHLERIIDDTGVTPGATSTGSPPRPGARWRRASCSRTARSRRSPPITTAPRPR